MKKEQEELDRAFGTGTKIKLPGKIAMMAAKKQGGEVEMATIMVYGDADKASWAQTLLMEFVDNKEQKQKQRQKVPLSVAVAAVLCGCRHTLPEHWYQGVCSAVLLTWRLCCA